MKSLDSANVKTQALYNFWLACILAMALLAGSANAIAQVIDGSTGYVCQVQFIPDNSKPTWWGKAGVVSFNLYSQPFCAGDLITFRRLYGIGATSSASVAKAQYSEAMLSTALAALQRASLTAQKIGVSNCGGNDDRCGYNLFFGFDEEDN